MLKKVKKLIGYYLYKEKSPYLQLEIAGVKLKGLKGAIRKKTDQDDAWFFELSKHHEILFDIGSNIGYMSLMAAMQKNNKQVVLVDPNPEVLAKAAQNLIINGYGIKSSFVSAFIGENDGEEIKFYTVGSGAAGSMYAGHAETASMMNSFYYVKQLTIDHLVEKCRCMPDLIKIDVEGAEAFALNGAIKTAAAGKAKFMIEMHSNPELTMEANAEKMLKWCSANNYKPFYMKEAVELKTASQIAHRGKCHLLLVPVADAYPDYLKTIKQGSPLPTTIN